MSFFPTRRYSLIYSGYGSAVDFLMLNTQVSASLMTQRTPKRFIGRIDNTQFALISSAAGIGAFTVLSGKFDNGGAILDVKINKPFKILISIIVVMFLAAVVLQVIRQPEWKTAGLLVPAVMFYFSGRLYVRYAFKRSLNVGLGHLQTTFVIEQTAQA
jgi:hypothetical protein